VCTIGSHQSANYLFVTMFKKVGKYYNKKLFLQEAKQKEMEALERERDTREKEEATLAATMQNSKKKLLNVLAAEEQEREDAVRKLQQLKDIEKEGLISSLYSGEQR
jgi:hypothetical protein